MKALVVSLLLLGITANSFAQSKTSVEEPDFGLSFMPDQTFKGSSLKGWHVIGAADWQAKDGELIGKAKPGSNGGWLVFDSSYQDIGFHALFKTTGSGESALLFRREKTDEGYRGVVLSLK